MVLLKIRLRAFIMVLLVKSLTCEFDEQIILNFIERKEITQVAFFTCDTEKDNVNLIRKFVYEKSVTLQTAIFNLENLNNVTVNSILFFRERQMAMIFESDCKNVKDILQEFGDKRFFYETFRWLIFSKHLNSIILTLQNVNININTDIEIVVKNVSLITWTVFECYNPAFRHNGILRLQKIGHWHNKTSNKIKYKYGKFHRRRNMSEVKFKTALVITLNGTVDVDKYALDETSRQNNTHSRYHSVAMRICRDYYNFSYDVWNITLLAIIHSNLSTFRIELMGTNSWGYEKSNGTFDGLVEILRTNKADFGSAPLFIFRARVHILSLGYGTWTFDTKFIFRHPKNTASSKEIYLRPFTSSVWFSLIFLLVLFVFIFRCAVPYETNTDMFKNHNTFSCIILNIIGILCQQGSLYSSRLCSIRISIFVALLFSFLVYQFYSGIIVSYLLMDPPRTITKVADLVKSTFAAGCEDTLFERNLLKLSTDPLVRELRDTKIRDNFYTAQMGFEKVRKEKFAFHTMSSAANRIIRATFSPKEICDLQEIRMYTVQPLYSAYPKRSPFRKLLNYCLVHQAEVGILDKLKRFWNSPKPQCVKTLSDTEIEVGIEEFYWALMVLLVGTISSIAIFCSEFLIIRKGFKEASLNKKERKPKINRKNKKHCNVKRKTISCNLP
ncbi:ionotropic receptor 75a-like isoform X2 [Agrilus planipennis]|uniref:Ionotropic receptor 75a-like isoform X2 n=1 Tax=Agrilus planipennis TaxID=224129 RepID=A0A1W4XDS1_AGRPL|nr:ionotropic receptor 75a-like isoform X2 [Agrilus planipennis]